MTKQRIEIQQSFNAPIEDIFKTLSDHVSFGKVIETKIKRVIDSQEQNKNGVGSVRRISSFPFPSFEETVLKFEDNKLIEYTVSKGSPIKNHKGRMEFTENNGVTNLYYLIEFDPKPPFEFLGSFLRKAIDNPIRTGLKKLSEKHDIG